MACKAEAQKNIFKLTELDEIIENSNKEKESLEKEFASYKIIMQNLETKLNKELLPSSNLLKNAFNNILLLQNSKNKKESS